MTAHRVFPLGEVSLQLQHMCLAFKSTAINALHVESAYHFTALHNTIGFYSEQICPSRWKQWLGLDRPLRVFWLLVGIFDSLQYTQNIPCVWLLPQLPHFLTEGPSLYNEHLAVEEHSMTSCVQTLEN